MITIQKIKVIGFVVITISFVSIVSFCDKVNLAWNLVAIGFRKNSMSGEDTQRQFFGLTLI